MDKTNEPIYRQADGNYTIHVNGIKYGVCDNNPAEKYTIDMVEAYLASHPEALVDEPVPPPPSAAELMARRIAEIKARLAEIDLKTARAGRCIAIGREVETNATYLTTYEDEAEGLRDELLVLA